MKDLRLGGDDLPRRLLAVALEWSAERLAATVGGCAILSWRHAPIAWAWGAADPDRADSMSTVAERLQHLLFPPGEACVLAKDAEDDPSQPTVVGLDRERLRGFAGALERNRVASPAIMVLRVEGRVAGVIWIAVESDLPSPVADGGRALRLVQPLLEIALRDRWEQEGPIGGDIVARGLTPREETVARLAIEGWGNAEIAIRLGIAQQTVRNHMSGVLAKCGIRTRTQLIALFGPDIDDRPGTLG